MGDVRFPDARDARVLNYTANGNSRVVPEHFCDSRIETSSASATRLSSSLSLSILHTLSPIFSRSFLCVPFLGTYYVLLRDTPRAV